MIKNVRWEVVIVFCLGAGLFSLWTRARSKLSSPAASVSTQVAMSASAVVSPQASASVESARSALTEKQYKAWFAETQELEDRVLLEERINLAYDLRIYRDAGAVLDEARIKELKEMLAQIKQDWLDVYRGQTMDFARLKGDVGQAINDLFKDPRIQHMRFTSLVALEKLYIQLHKLDGDDELRPQAEAHWKFMYGFVRNSLQAEMD